MIVAIRTRLIKDKELRSPNIEVKALQCHIILLGLVGSQGEISKAVAHAKGVKGVRGVASYLKVMQYPATKADR